MTDESQGHGWWQASDLKWYPPEQRPGYGSALPPPPAADAAQQSPADSARVIPRDKLGPLTKIGQGGQGVVYRAPNVKTKFTSSMVYKEYKPQFRTEIDFSVLTAMPALVEESLTYSQAERLISIAAWPCAIVEDAGTPTGFVMPAIPEEFFIPLTTAKGVSSSIAEFQHLLNHPTVLAARGITLDDAQRFSLLHEVASALAFLHKHGVCVGDISPKNLLFCLAPQQAVYFIDCDAMRINTVSALAQVETPGWNAPAGEELATVYTDTYKLGLLALRLLAGDQDTTNPRHLRATTPTQVRQLITDTLTNRPHQRPLPDAWTSVLGHAVEHAQHQQKSATPLSAPPPPPPTPIVRSRPTPHSAPPVRPPAPPAVRPQPADRAPTAIATPSPRQWWLRAGIPVALLAVAVFVTIVITGQQKDSNSSQHPEPNYGPQISLPFPGLQVPNFVAADSAGNVYVASYNYSRVMELAAGSNSPTTLPLDVRFPTRVAVDTAGNLYVADASNDRVLKLAAGSSTPTVLPFTGLRAPQGVAVDATGNVYVADEVNHRVVKLAAGSSTQTVLPFTGLDVLYGVAVDAAGNVYVADASHPRVLKLAAGSSTQSVLPFTDLSWPEGVAVNAAGDVYVTDHEKNRILKLPAGSSTQIVLPFTGLTGPNDVAVDTAGNIYVATGFQVVKLPVA